MSKYVFDPTLYGFVPLTRAPELLRDYLALQSFVKIVETSTRGAYWYISCNHFDNKIGGDRWEFTSGVVNRGRPKIYHIDHRIYLGCITSQNYAKELLIHLLGTTTDSGTITYGRLRLKAESKLVE